MPLNQPSHDLSRLYLCCNLEKTMFHHTSTATVLTSAIIPSEPVKHCQNCYLLSNCCLTVIWLLSVIPGLLSSWNKAGRFGTILHLSGAKQVFPILGTDKKLQPQEHWHPFSLKVVQLTGTEVTGLYWEGFCWRQEGRRGQQCIPQGQLPIPWETEPRTGNWGQNPALNPDLQSEEKMFKNRRGNIKLGWHCTPEVLRVCQSTLCKISQNWPLIFPDHPTFLPDPCQLYHSHTRIWLLQSGRKVQQQQFKYMIKTWGTNHLCEIWFQKFAGFTSGFILSCRLWQLHGGYHVRVVPWNTGNAILNITLDLMTPQMNLWVRKSGFLLPQILTHKYPTLNSCVSGECVALCTNKQEIEKLKLYEYIENTLIPQAVSVFFV